MVLNFLFAAAMPQAEAATGASPEDFYKGKVVKIYVAAAGGVHEMVSRMIAPYLTKYTGATYVVETLTAGGGLEAHNRVWTAKPDGLTLGCHSASSLMLNDAFDAPGTIAQVEKLVYLADTGTDPSILVSRAGKFKTFSDLKKTKGLRVGVLSPTGGRTLSSLGWIYGADLDAKLVAGYKGSADVETAMVRDEIDLTGVSVATYLKGAKGGRYSGFGVFETSRLKVLPDLPALTDLMAAGAPKEKRELLATLTQITGSGVIYFAPPGFPEERAVYLRRAFEQIMKDPDFLKEYQKAWGGYFPPRKTADQLANAAIELKKMKKSLQDQVSALLKKYLL